MFRAVYDYKTDMKQYLSFQTGDQFTVLDSSNKDWFLAQNGFGEIGYIPRNYVVKDQATENEVLKSIDRAIEVIHYDASSKGGQYTHIQRENLKKLVEHRDNVIQSYKTGQDSADWVMVSKPSSEDDQPKRRSVRRTAPAPPVRSSAEVTTTSSARTSREVTADSATLSGEVPLVVDLGNSSPSQSVLNVGSTSFQDSQIGEIMNKQEVRNVERKMVNLTLQNEDKATTIDSVPSLDCATSPIPSPTKSSPSKSVNVTVNCRTVPIPNDLGSDLVEKVRRNTGLSYPKSCIAVETVLEQIGIDIPQVLQLMNRIHATMQETSAETVEEESSSDYERLCELFDELRERKDDSQQRGWHLHEDSDIIHSHLEEMLSILENAKQSTSRKAMARDSYEGIHNLVQYYQMENRLHLRLAMVRVFGAMCSLDSAVISLLLFSVLTTELAEDLQQNIEDVQRSCYVSLLLAMLFCTGELVPANLHDHLDKEFLHFVFTTLENPPSEAHEEQLTDLLVNFILAFNLHFHEPKDNLVMQVIGEKRTVKTFTEKILLLFNRDDDPVQMFDHQKKDVNSVMKLLQDLYSSEATAMILYTNDARVLIDIIMRHLIDLPPGDMDRSAHLKLMRLYLQNADYAEHKHRYSELSSCLHRIQTEEENTGDDKHICEFILTQLNLFVD